MAVVRYTVYFSGRVQGVGFRYTAVQAAKHHRVAGIVENLANGRVRMIAEGEAGPLDGLVTEINQRMAGFITDCTIQKGASTQEFGAPAVGALSVRY